MKLLRHILAVLGPLAVLSGVLGMTGRLVDSRRELRAVSSSSAKYIGDFPQNLKQITELVKSTQRHLVVVADYPGYANYTDPKLFDEYWKEIKALAARSAPKVRIDVYFYNSATADCAQQLQFAQKRSPESADAWKTDPRFARYMTHRRIPENQQPRTSAALDQLLLKFDEDMIRQMQDLDIRVRRVSVLLPLFIWMKDEEEAVFSFYNLGDDVREVSLETRDAQLIQTLLALEKAISEGKVPGAPCVPEHVVTPQHPAVH